MVLGRLPDGPPHQLIASLIAPDCPPHQVRVRCEDGTVLRLTLRAADPLSMIASAVEAQRPEGAGPFVLRVPFPSREYASVEELSSTSVRMLIAC
jgi:hypothetical protein